MVHGMSFKEETSDHQINNSLFLSCSIVFTPKIESRSHGSDTSCILAMSATGVAVICQIRALIVEWSF